jgi:hypothetical protein
VVIRIPEGFCRLRRNEVWNANAVNPQKRKPDMKATKRYLLAAVAALTFASLNTALAGNPLTSPRAKSNEIKVVAGTTADQIDRSVQVATPKGREQMASRITGSGKTADALDRSVAVLPPKLRELRGTTRTFSVAPLK